MLGKFQEKLDSWCQLRHHCGDLDLQSSLLLINQWWFRYPWTAYTLHWDDRSNWPDPWQLLEEPRLCSLARGLGILYTIAMLDRLETQDTVLVETSCDNLVLVQREKYILNWDAEQVLNINPSTEKTQHHQLTLVEAQQRIR